MNTKRGRDQAIERLLRQSGQSGRETAPPGSCLDAEMLAAWVEGGLSQNDRAIAERHVSECARCQAFAAAWVRTSEPARASARWWQRPWTVGWLVPATAGAVAIAVWVALPERERSTSPEQAGVRTQGNATSRAEETESLVGRVQSPQVGGDERRAAAPARQERAGGAGEPGKTRIAEAKGGNDGAKNDAFRASADSLGKVEERVRAAPVPAAPAAETSTFAADRLAASSRQAAIVAREVASPDPLIRWRIGAAGQVQHSADGGATWDIVSTGVAAELLAGASPSSSVCWLVGRAATVLLTTDGRRFQRVAFPENVDLAGVRATDARTAVVTTVDGRAFGTTDGGSTWTRDPR